MRKIGQVTTIPMLFVAGPLVGFWFGAWIDQKFTSDPWGKTILALLGFAASIKRTIVIIKDWTQEEESENQK